MNPAPMPEVKTEERPALPRALPTLKNVIVQCVLEGLISTRVAEDLISHYGLRHT